MLCSKFHCAEGGLTVPIIFVVIMGHLSISAVNAQVILMAEEGDTTLLDSTATTAQVVVGFDSSEVTSIGVPVTINFMITSGERSIATYSAMVTNSMASVLY